MSKETSVRSVWNRPVLWVTAFVVSVAVTFGLQDIVNEFVGGFAICVMFFAPFMAIGTSTGHTKGGLAVGLGIVTLYLAAVWYVNSFGS